MQVRLGVFRDVDVSVRFKPISGREDASGGIVFRFGFVVRFHCLELLLDVALKINLGDRTLAFLAAGLHNACC